jgi:hypothetical protein
VAGLVIVDTSGLASGVYPDPILLRSARPDVVIGLQRGEELDPILDERRFPRT